MCALVAVRVAPYANKNNRQMLKNSFNEKCFALKWAKKL